MPIIPEKAFYERLLGPEAADCGLSAHLAGQLHRPWSNRTFKRIAHYNSDSELKRELSGHWKSYPAGEKVSLTQESAETALSFGEVLRSRRATRKFSGTPLPLAKLAALLDWSIGKSLAERRPNAPSAGARTPCEMYLCILKVEGVKPGFYHYNRVERSLELIDVLQEPQPTMVKLGWDDHLIEIEKACAVVTLAAVFHRTVRKYGERGWRYVHLDTGHLGQNLWLSATALDIACCASAGGYDREIAKAFGLNVAIEAPLLSYVIGLDQ